MSFPCVSACCVACSQGYRAVLLQTLPQLRVLDCKDIFGEPVSLSDGDPSRLQCFEGLLENLVSSESPLNISEDEVRWSFSALKTHALSPIVWI